MMADDIAADHNVLRNATHSPPTPLHVNFKNIPSDMRLQVRWMLWRYEERDGKYSKVPYQINGKKASPASSLTWTTFEKVKDAFVSSDYDGIGFALGNGFIGIDMDDCVGAGVMSPQARGVLTLLDSYAEISPSGKGMHIICRGEFPETGRRKGGLEVYGKGHYFSVTGALIGRCPKSIPQRTDALIELYKEHFDESRSKHEMQRQPSSLGHIDLADEEIKAKAARALNGDLFVRLMAGDISGYPSQSEADLALVNILAFYTKDRYQIDRIFRDSSLCREKWEREDYRQRTIDSALARVKDQYGATKNPTEEDEEPLTEGGNASRLIAIHGKNMRFCHNHNKWYIWDGLRWKLDGNGEVLRLAEDVVKALYREAAEAADLSTRNRFANFAKACDRNAHLRNILDIAKNRPSIAIIADQLDQDEWLLNAANATLDLRTGQPIEPKRERLMTKAAGAEYNPDATCPRLMKFLDEIFKGDQELIGYVKRAVGYSLTGSMVEQVFFFCHGSGANGKSVFLIVLRALLGDYAQQTDFSTFLTQRNERIRNDLAALAGARVITALEAEEGVKLSMQVIKHWTGGDPISARFLYAEFFTFKPAGKIWLAANTKPIISERNYAAWRRLHLIPFLVTIPQEKQDRELESKLMNELPGILNWALEGLREYQRIGLRPPKAVQAATEAYRRDNDSIEAFIGECCIVKIGLSIQNKRLFGAYEAFCRNRGYDPLTNRKFIEELRTAPAIKEDNILWAGITWHGIDLVTPGEAPDHQTQKTDCNGPDRSDLPGEPGQVHRTFPCGPHVDKLEHSDQVHLINASIDSEKAPSSSPGTPPPVGLVEERVKERPCSSCGVALRGEAEGPCGFDCAYRRRVIDENAEDNARGLSRQ